MSTFADRVVVHRSGNGETTWTAWSQSDRVATQGETHQNPRYTLERASILAGVLEAELIVEAALGDDKLRVLAEVFDASLRGPQNI